ncbi:hypothetical protein AB0R99_00075 [Erwinia amylovora]|uniref:hypothetical protein n=1 Tax=Erwinia amylovora TaxID=552 RepID=UPI0037DDBD95
MNRLVIYLTTGKVIQFDDVENVNHKSDTLYFELKGYSGDNGKSFFRNIAGCTLYTSKEK